MEYARLRMQLVENSSFHPVSQLRHDQHLSRSDSHLASIPENSPEGNSAHSETQIQMTQETLILNYRSEIFRLQEENRKIQRKYWEQVNIFMFYISYLCCSCYIVIKLIS